MSGPDALIRKAEEVAVAAAAQGTPLLVIGAAALAGHRYVRLTHDLDLAGNLSVDQLRGLASTFETRDVSVELRLPDGDDPLGGVLDLQGAFGQIQVVSFAERFPAVIRDALAHPPMKVRQDGSLHIIPLPHLVVLKLYAGGFKSKADIVEVLSRNPEQDLDEIGALCDRYRIRGFAEIRGELEG